VTAILTIWGCRREEPAPPQPAEWRGLLLRTLAQAGRDSATLVAGAFHARVSMNIALRQSGGDTVRVDERFLLKKERGRG
jgi:hypothetical protein